ncbi:MAG: hypothetical protein ACFUZC_20270 [Chthoniobacteraceae bacterium]
MPRFPEVPLRLWMRNAAGVAALLLLCGCQVVKEDNSSDLPLDPTTRACVDPGSGLVFPKYLDGQTRVSVTQNAPSRGCLQVYYEKKQTPTTTNQLNYYLHCRVFVIPKSMITPDGWIKVALREAQEKPNFTREEYQGQRIFGKESALVAQAAFDRPVWNDRALVKLAVVQRGNYLICFDFGIAAVYEKEWQPSIDCFVEAILESR